MKTTQQMYLMIKSGENLLKVTRNPAKQMEIPTIKEDWELKEPRKYTAEEGGTAASTIQHI